MVVEVDGSNRPDRTPPDMTWTKQELGEDLVRKALQDYQGDWDDLMKDVYEFLVDKYWLIKEDEYPYKEETWDLRDKIVDGIKYLLPIWWPWSLEGVDLTERERVLWFQLVMREYLPENFFTIKNIRLKNLIVLSSIPHMHLLDRENMLPIPPEN